MRRLIERLERVPEGLLLTLAFVLRAGFALSLGQRFHQIDEVGFFGPADQWARTGLIGAYGKAGMYSPVTSVFFGSFYRWLGLSYTWPRLGQAVVGTLTALAVGRLAKRWSGSQAAGRLALLIAAVYPFFIYYGGMLISETLYTTGWAGGLCLLAASLDNESPVATSAGAGLLLSAAALTRVEGAGAGAAVWAAALVLCLGRYWSWKAWAAGALAFALPIIGWSARNRALCGRFALDDHGGITLVHGTILYDTDYERGTAAAMAEAARQPWYQQIQQLPEGERQAAYAREALRFMRENPGRVAAQWARKFVSFWRFYPRQDSGYYETDVSNPNVGLSRRLLIVVSLLFEPWLILLGAAGFWTLRRRAVSLPLIIFITASTAAHVLIVSMMRYRLPVMPVMIAAAASWIALKADGRPAPKARA